MFKLIKEEAGEERIIPMSDMKPLEIGRIVDNNFTNYDDFDGHCVMRTANTTHFEVMDLSEPGASKCWTNLPAAKVIRVQLLLPGEQITLEVV